jgi:hypothetical protein
LAFNRDFEESNQAVLHQCDHAAPSDDDPGAGVEPLSGADGAL